MINDISDRQYASARKRVLQTIGEAGRLIAVEGNMNSALDAEDFVKNYIAKKLKIVKMCNANNLSDCGWADSITILDKSVNSKGNTSITPPKKLADMIVYASSLSTTNEIKYRPSYGFVTANGYSVILTYNPKCMPDNKQDNDFASDYV